MSTCLIIYSEMMMMLKITERQVVRYLELHVVMAQACRELAIGTRAAADALPTRR